MVGVEGMQESQMGAMNVVTKLANYQQMGELIIPTLLVQDVGAMQTVHTTIETVDFDPIDAAVFALPAAIQALMR